MYVTTEGTWDLDLNKIVDDVVLKVTIDGITDDEHSIQLRDLAKALKPYLDELHKEGNL
jgi:hypothetical protein